MKNERVKILDCVNTSQDEAVREVSMLLDLANEAYDKGQDSWEMFDLGAQKLIATYSTMFGVTYAEFEDWVIEYRMFGEGMCDFEG